MSADLSVGAYEALRRAVAVAKELQIGTVRRLRGRLVAEGYPEQDVDDALRCWADRVRETGPGGV